AGIDAMLLATIFISRGGGFFVVLSNLQPIEEKSHMRRTSAVIATLTSLLATQAMGADTTPHTLRIKNYNCVWQGLVRTNQVKIHVWKRAAKPRWEVPGPFDVLPPGCTDRWVSIHDGRTAEVKVDPYMENSAYVTSGPALECTYEVEA